MLPRLRDITHGIRRGAGRFRITLFHAFLVAVIIESKSSVASLHL